MQIELMNTMGGGGEDKKEKKKKIQKNLENK